MVYLMHVMNVDSRLHKIGYAADVERRRRELSREFCTVFEVVDSIEVDDDRGVECWFHEIFSRERVDGELFLLDSGRVTYWCALAEVLARSRGCVLVQ